MTKRAIVAALIAAVLLVGSEPRDLCWYEWGYSARDDAGRDSEPRVVTFCRGGFDAFILRRLMDDREVR